MVGTAMKWIAPAKTKDTEDWNCEQRPLRTFIGERRSKMSKTFDVGYAMRFTCTV